MIKFIAPPLALILALSGAPAFAASLSSDLFEDDPAADSLIDPSAPSQALPGLLDDVAASNRNYAELTDVLEIALMTKADYSGILAIAPQLIPNAPDPDRVRWMHALALAATGELIRAEAIVANIKTPSDQYSGAFLAKAMLKHRSGDTQAAIDLTRQAILLQPNHAYAYNLMGLMKAGIGETEEAVEWMQRATTYASESEVYWRNLGILNFRRDEVNTALSALQRAIAINPEDCISLVASAQVYEAAQQPDKAEDFVTRCLSAKTGDTALAARYLLDLQFAQDRFDAARATVDAYEDLLPSADLIRAEIGLFENKPDAALAALKDADPGRPKELRRTLALAMKGDTLGAMEALEGVPVTNAAEVAGSAFIELALSVALSQNLRPYSLATARKNPALAPTVAWFEALNAVRTRSPDVSEAVARAENLLPGVRFTGVPDSDWVGLRQDSARAKAALGMLWLARDYNAAAAATFDALSAQSNVQMARYFASLADLQQDNNKRAIDRLAPTADAYPAYFSAQVLSAELHLRFGQLDKALARYQTAATSLEDAGVLMRVGVLADMQGDPVVAEDALRRFIALNPDSFVGYNQLAWVFIQRETRLDEALDLARKADALQPGNASVLDNIGWTLFLTGDARSALDLLRDANQRSGGVNPDILYHLAAVEADLGATDRSKALLAKLFKAAPEDHPSVVQGRALRTRLE